VILDVNCFAGYWPFRRITYRTVADLKRLMARTSTQGALVTPLAGVFYKDCLSAVREILDDLEASPHPNMWPVAVVNPTFPGWREDLAIMVDEWGCVALRLFPTYHGYRLCDPQAIELLKVVRDRELPLIISARIEDERLHHWLVRVQPVSSLDLTWLLRTFFDIKLVLSDLNLDEIDRLSGDILAHPRASVDTSGRTPEFYIEDTVGQLGSDRVMYGTGMPLKYPESARDQVDNALLSEDARRKLLGENACRMFGLNMEKV